MASTSTDIQLAEVFPKKEAVSSSYIPGQFMSLGLNGIQVCPVFSPHKNFIKGWTFEILRTLFGGRTAPVFQEKTVNYNYCASAFEASGPLLRSKQNNFFSVNGTPVDRIADVWDTRDYPFYVIKVGFTSWNEFFDSVRLCDLPAMERDFHFLVELEENKRQETVCQLETVKAVLVEKKFRQVLKDKDKVSGAVRLLQRLVKDDPTPTGRIQHLWDHGTLEELESGLHEAAEIVRSGIKLAEQEKLKFSRLVRNASYCLEQEEKHRRQDEEDLRLKRAIFNCKLDRVSPDDPKLSLMLRRFIKGISLSHLPYEPALVNMLAWKRTRGLIFPVSVVLQHITVKPEATELQQFVLMNFLAGLFTHTILVSSERNRRSLSQQNSTFRVDVVCVKKDSEKDRPVPKKDSIMALVDIDDENGLVQACFRAKNLDRITVFPEIWDLSSSRAIEGDTLVCDSNYKVCLVDKNPTSQDFRSAETMDLTIATRMPPRFLGDKNCENVWEERLSFEESQLTNKSEGLLVALQKYKTDLANASFNVQKLSERLAVLRKRTNKLLAKKPKKHSSLVKRERWLAQKLRKLKQERVMIVRDDETDELKKLSIGELEKKVVLLEEEKDKLETLVANVATGQTYKEIVQSFLLGKNAAISPEGPFDRQSARNAMVEVIRAMDHSVVFVDGDFPEIVGKQIMVVEN